jgi:Zn-finger nucleic acid-binding protein
VAPDSEQRMSCPWCGGVTSRLAGRCAQCGQRLGPQSERDHTKPVACPTCARETAFLGLGQVNVDHCLACGGIWFDDGELDALPEALSEKELAAEAAAALRSGQRARAGADARTYLPCPVCAATMNRRNYRDVSGIILHRCAGHGTWLDGTNAPALLRLLAEGRLPEIERRARAAAAALERRGAVDADAERTRRIWEARNPEVPAHPQPGSTPLRQIIWSLLDFLF